MSKDTEMQPPCAEWSVWVGAEVEGDAETGKGIRTLFIRSLASFKGLMTSGNTADLSILRTKSKCSRVWFCKEFDNWALLEAIAEHFDEVCVEVLPKCYSSIPSKFRKNYRIYLKVDCDLKPGDVVCVGPAFKDEAFTIGKGNKVKPEDYANDKRII